MASLGELLAIKKYTDQQKQEQQARAKMKGILGSVGSLQQEAGPPTRGGEYSQAYQGGSGLLGRMGAMAAPDTPMGVFAQMATTPGYEQAGLQGMSSFVDPYKQSLTATNMASAADANKFKWDNVKVDDSGQWWGIAGGNVQKIPSSEAERFIKYKQVQGTDAEGNPATNLVQVGANGKTANEIQIGRKGLPSETAGKLTMLQTARDRIPVIEKYLFNEDGSFNDLNVFNMQMSTPWTTGRQIGAMFEVGIQGITRVETGAAMPPGEVENTRKRFQPQIFDDEMTKRVKWEMYQDFLNNNIQAIKPAFDSNKGVYKIKPEKLNAELDAELQRRLANKQTLPTFAMERNPKQQVMPGLSADETAELMQLEKELGGLQ